MIMRLASASAAAIPVSLMVFIAAIFLTYGVTTFSTIYAVPGHPVHSVALWCSFVSSMAAAALWTTLSAKKELIEKTALSGPGDVAARNQHRTQMWDDVALKALLYLGGAAACSVLAMVILVVP
jgi:hypothetical protein